MSEVGVTRDQIDIVRWTSSNDLGRRAAALLQRQNYGEGGKTVMKGVNFLGVPVGLLSVTFPDLPAFLQISGGKRVMGEGFLGVGSRRIRVPVIRGGSRCLRHQMTARIVHVGHLFFFRTIEYLTRNRKDGKRQYDFSIAS